jgi:hypothetical protein
VTYATPDPGKTTGDRRQNSHEYRHAGWRLSNCLHCGRYITPSGDTAWTHTDSQRAEC